MWDNTLEHQNDLHTEHDKNEKYSKLHASEALFRNNFHRKIKAEYLNIKDVWEPIQLKGYMTKKYIKQAISIEGQICQRDLKPYFLYN